MMKGSLQILVLLFGCSFLIGVVSGQDDTKCKSILDAELNSDRPCESDQEGPDFKYHVCCRWKDDKKEGLCCPVSSGGSFECEDGYNEKTCKMPTCKPLKKNENCEEAYGELPEGIQEVKECCRLDDNGKKEAAQCCVVTGGDTKCGDGFPEENCGDYDW